MARSVLTGRFYTVLGAGLFLTALNLGWRPQVGVLLWLALGAVAVAGLAWQLRG